VKKLLEKINLVIGFDQKEAIAYHVFCQSIIEKSTIPVQILPLALNTLSKYSESHFDGSNTFIYSRFLTPFLMNFSGWAIFADGDMICKSDLAELWRLRDPKKAVQVVKHDYKTKQSIKYLGNKNLDYPKKNWSSLIMWNCEHPKHKLLTPKFIKNQTGPYLHRFSWLEDDEIGELNAEWNWLAIEYKENINAKLIHYTLGTPCFKDYKTSEMSDEWHRVLSNLNEGIEK
jgi:lipopolysaccharide biosynthesis glycosyltransferase